MKRMLAFLLAFLLGLALPFAATAEIWMDVDAAIAEAPITITAIIDDTNFKTREDALTYNQAGLDLVWNFVTTAGAMTQTAVTPTESAGDYDWTNEGNGLYAIEIPASSGASINNDTEGCGWFTGFATGVLPWTGPVICFRDANLNNALVDGAATVDGVPSNLVAMGADTQSATDLKDFADAGYDPATDSVTVGGMSQAALADFILDDSGTTYASAVSGSVAYEIAENSAGSGLTAEQTRAALGGFGGTIGTYTAGGPTVTLGNGSASDDEYNDVATITFFDVSDSNEPYCTRTIVDWDGGTQTATLDSACTTVTPQNSTDTYAVSPNESPSSSPTAATVANAVWDELVGEARTSDSYGDMINDVFTDTGGTYYLATLDEDSTTFDWDGTTLGTVSTLTGHTPQTGDSYAIVNHGTYGNAQLVRSTTPANTLDVAAGGEAGVDLDNASGQLDAANVGEWAVLDTGTAAAVAAGTITLDGSPAFAADELNVGASVVILSATTGAGQCRKISDLNGSNVATLSDDWQTTPTGTITYAVIPGAFCAAFAEVSDTTSAIQVGPDGLVWADVREYNDTDISEDTAGYPTVTIKDGTGAGEINTASGAIVSVTTADTCTDLGASAVDDILDEPLAGHSTEDTLGKEVADAGGAGDPWSTSIPGAYGAGTAGYILGTNLDEQISVVEGQTDDIGVAGAGLTAIDLPNQTMDITGSLSGSVGSVTGAVGSVTGAVGSVTGNVGGDVQGNVDGSVASVTGAVGSVTGAVGSVTGAVGSVTGNVGGNVTGSIGSLAAQAKADVNAEADTALTDYDPPTATELAMLILQDATYLKCTVDTANWPAAASKNSMACDLTDKDGNTVTSANNKLEGNAVIFATGNNKYEKRYISTGTAWDGANSELRISIGRSLPNNIGNGDIAYIL